MRKTDNIRPLFSIVENGRMVPVVPEVKSGSTTYQAEDFILALAKAIETDAKALYSGDSQRGGELTLGAYILLETLHRVGLADLAGSIMTTPTALEQAALFFQLGLHTGRRIPEEVTIGTKKAPSGPSVRSGGSGEDQGPN
jgi:hypothetical protein